MKIAEQSVELIDYMGNDLSVVNAARVSFAKESDWAKNSHGEYFYNSDTGQERLLEEKDTKLINYLAKHNHWTPFAHCFVSFRINAPIFVARQLVKHQVGLAWNEVSRRYVNDEPEFWFPKEWRGAPVNAKQGSDGVVKLSHPDLPEVVVRTALRTYNQLISENVAPELARIVLPANTMTEWIWSGSLAAFARVCKLRLDPHAQLETQDLVKGIYKPCTELWPVAFKALMEQGE